MLKRRASPDIFTEISKFVKASGPNWKFGIILMNLEDYRLSTDCNMLELELYDTIFSCRKGVVRAGVANNSVNRVIVVGKS